MKFGTKIVMEFLTEFVMENNRKIWWKLWWTFIRKYKASCDRDLIMEIVMKTMMEIVTKIVMGSYMKIITVIAAEVINLSWRTVSIMRLKSERKKHRGSLLTI